MSEVKGRNEITIEMVDEVMARVPFITTREAKEALEATNGNVIDAIIYFEESEEYAFYYEDEDFDYEFTENEEEGKKFNEKFSDIKDNLGQDTEKIRARISELLKKSNVIRIKVDKNGKDMINIPLTVGVIGIAAMPLLALFGLSAAVLSKYSVKITDEKSDEEVDIGKLNTEKLDILKEMFLASFNDIKDSFKKSDEESADENEEITIEVVDEVEESENEEVK